MSNCVLPLGVAPGCRKNVVGALPDHPCQLQNGTPFDKTTKRITKTYNCSRFSKHGCVEILKGTFSRIGDRRKNNVFRKAAKCEKSRKYQKSGFFKIGRKNVGLFLNFKPICLFLKKPRSKKHLFFGCAASRSLRQRDLGVALTISPKGSFLPHGIFRAHWALFAQWTAS